jgi:uncharacterized membrane protein
MTNLSSLTTTQLRQVLALKEQIEALQSQLESIVGGEVPTPATEEEAVPNPKEAPVPAKRKYHMSAAHRRKLIKALARVRKIRWAKAKGTKTKPARKDWRSSPAVRAKLSAAAKLRWAKARAEGRTRL